MKRRHALLSLLAAAEMAPAQNAERPHDPFGPVRPPLPALPLALLGHDGRRFELGAHLRGRTTALQLMFTTCSATCPIQGALFGAVAPLIAGQAGLQLLSLSIDPRADDPKALHGWLARFGAAAGWRAAAPRIEDVDRLLDYLRGRAQGADRHNTQVYLFDRQSRLAYRSAEMPPARFVADLLTELSRRS